LRDLPELQEAAVVVVAHSKILLVPEALVAVVVVKEAHLPVSRLLLGR
jgi:hypothetical protein